MTEAPKCWAVIPAAGAGLRMGSAVPKQYLKLHGKYVLEHTLKVFCSHPEIAGVVVALADGDPYWHTMRIATHAKIRCTTGGAERCHSVYNGLRQLTETAASWDWVLVHDAARPCLRGSDISLIPQYPVPRRLIQWAAANASAMITVCDALKTELVALGADPARITPLRNGVDLQRFRQGDRVAGKVLWGGFAEQAVAREDMLIRLPQDVSFAEGATLPVIWPTAWIALHDRARLLEGETVLVHAAAGGVGAAAVQLARAAGARVFATAGGADKLALCRALGAEEAFDYRAGPWLELLLASTGGRGVDVVFDPVGGEITDLSVKALARNGRLLIVGFASGAIFAIKANRLLLKNASALGVYWSHETDATLVARALEDVLALRGAGKIRLLVGQRYPFAELPRALADLEARRTTGKSVIMMEQGAG